MRQTETSRTLVFDADVHARAFFESLLRENMDLGRGWDVVTVLAEADLRRVPESRIQTALAASLSCEVRIVVS